MSRRAWTTGGTGRHALNLLGGALVALATVGCGDDGAGPTNPGVTTLEAAEARWRTTATVNYKMEQRRDCFCVDGGRLFDVTVVGGIVVTAVDRETQQSAPANMLQYFRPVAQLFTEIKSALANSSARVDVTYDPVSGVPTHLWVDPNPMLADEEFGYRTGNIRPFFD